MNYKKFNKILLKTSLLFFAHLTCAMNIPVFYDTLILPEVRTDERFQFYAILQTGFSTKSFDECECCANVLRIWNKDQNAIKMLEGFCSDTPIGQLRTRIKANDDGTRGHFSVCGDLDVDFAGEFGFEYRFRDDFFVSAHLPVFSMKLKNVFWKDLTKKDVSFDDSRVREYLTNDFIKNVRGLGCLDICGWKRSGVGDLLLLAGWRRDFEQSKKMLKNVRLGARVGLTLPTGKKADEDKIFAFSYGNDGAVGTLVGGSLDLTFGQYVKAGLDVQLLHVFGNTKCRRIKTHFCQTDLLLLKKVDVYKEYGLTQRFNLYIQFYRFVRGLSCKLGYQFRRRSEDMLYICSNEFSNRVANTAGNLQEWTMHNLVVNLSYDFWNEDDDRSVYPYISAFVKIPFNGMNTAMARTVGFTFAIDF